MADATVKKLLGLLDAKQPAALRRAAALVLGEIGVKEREVGEALCAVLDDADAELRVAAMKAVGALKVEAGLKQLLARVALGGEEADVAAQAAASLGAKGVHALQDMMHKTAPGLRRRIAGALATGGSRSAETAALETLLDGDPGVIDAACRTLIAEIRALPPAQRKTVADQVFDLLGSGTKKEPLSPHSEIALLRLFAAVGDARVEEVCWPRTEAGRPLGLRNEALQALGKLPELKNKHAPKALLACALDRDFRVVAPALMMLKNENVTGKNLAAWLPLLEAHDVATRRFAIEKFAGRESPELAAALLTQLKHPDRGLREQALAALGKMEHGRDALAGELLAAGTVDEAWQLARAQTGLSQSYSAALRTKIFSKASAYLEVDDRRGDALLSVLRHADAKELRDRLAERAVALRKKKQYDGALHYLRLLAQDPACGEAMRFELAACGLKVSAKDLALPSRGADPCLHQFARLIHSHETPPLTYVQKAAWLEAEDLFYLGFHFVEASGPEREFGGEVLKLLLKKAGRTKLAKDAKAKLKGAGLD